MTAPVARFSLSAPDSPVIIIPRDAKETDTAIPSNNPIIIKCLRVKLLYRFCMVLEW